VLLELRMLWVERRHAVHRVQPLLRCCLLSPGLVVFEAIQTLLVCSHLSTVGLGFVGRLRLNPVALVDQVVDLQVETADSICEIRGQYQVDLQASGLNDITESSNRFALGCIVQIGHLGRRLPVQ
jgi:hypothetical protein